MPYLYIPTYDGKNHHNDLMGKFSMSIDAIHLDRDMQTHDSTNPSVINRVIVVHCLETIRHLIGVENSETHYDLIPHDILGFSS